MTDIIDIEDFRARRAEAEAARKAAVAAILDRAVPAMRDIQAVLDQAKAADALSEAYGVDLPWARDLLPADLRRWVTPVFDDFCSMSLDAPAWASSLLTEQLRRG